MPRRRIGVPVAGKVAGALRSSVEPVAFDTELQKIHHQDTKTPSQHRLVSWCLGGETNRFSQEVPMPLDPQAKALLDQFAAVGGQPLSSMSVADARRMMEMLSLMRGESPPIRAAGDRHIPGPAGDIPVRIYTPNGTAPFALLVY